MANLNDVLQGLVNLNSKMANNINNLLDSIGEGFLDVGELKVENDMLSLQGATLLVNGSNILVENLSTTFAGNRICFLEYKADKSIALKVLSVVDANFNYDLSQLNATSKHFEIARQYNGVLEDRRVASMASKDNTIVGALNGALKAIDYDNEMDLEINLDILSRISTIESDIVDLENIKASKQYVDEAIANNVPEIDGMVKAVDVTGTVEGIDATYVTHAELDEILDGNTGGGSTGGVNMAYVADANDFFNLQGQYATKDSTLNLPGDIDSSSKWGFLITQFETEYNSGYQQFIPSWGSWSGVVFTRSFRNLSGTLIIEDWGYLLNSYNYWSSLQTSDKSIIGAINELFTSANNGKELIADAIGEPLASTDTFSAMSNDINSLLSTFKSNMMNNGVTVESGDKFKQLIDKLANLSDSEGKGIQYATGTIRIASSTAPLEVSTLTFKPDIILIHYLDGYLDTLIYNKYLSETYYYQIDYASSGTTFTSRTLSDTYYVNETGFKLQSAIFPADKPLLWHAIGVGAEDTTLRDSLASILQDAGVEVIEDEEMASLIVKTDAKLDEATSSKNRLYELMSESGYDVNNSMSLDSLLDLLELSGISVGDIKQIACGHNYTFILKTNGSLWCCGQNNYNQLGLGDTTNRTAFVQVTTNINNDVTQVACGQSHTIIQKKDGTLWGCGYNYYGQLGLGNNTNQSTFTRIANNINNDVKQIACGSNHTFVLKTDGSIWSCGYNSYGQLGLSNSNNKTSFTQVTPNINNDVKQVACGNHHTVILKTDGSIWGCGYNYYGQLGLSDPANKTMFFNIANNINNDVKQIACGLYYTFVLKTDGSIWSCGRNNNGQLGLNNTTNQSTFTQVTTNINNDVKQVACGGEYTMVIKSDGSLWSCGTNSYGQLGLNDTDDRTTFTQVISNINNDVKQVVCGDQHVFILKNDSSILSCGYNTYGQLGFNITDVTIFITVTRGF